jgi:maleylacetoacetate isomerase/maleylpyruvate isomerase
VPELILYTYFRSSAAFRVRIALALKAASYDERFVSLTRQGGEQREPAYLTLNPLGLVPVLIVDGKVLTQSLAIIEFLEEMIPEPALLPRDALKRAQVRALAQNIACDIHPLQNLRVRRYLEQRLNHSADETLWWCRHWISEGLRATEQQLPHEKSSFAFGSQPSLADVCIVPQVYNALRYECLVSDFPRLYEIYETCMTLPVFQRAAPGQQADADG